MAFLEYVLLGNECTYNHGIEMNNNNDNDYDKNDRYNDDTNNSDDNSINIE